MLWEIKHKNRLDIRNTKTSMKLPSLPLVQSMAISIPRNWILRNYRRLFPVVLFTGPCGRESGLALQVKVEGEKKKVPNHCILGFLITPFSLPMLKVMVVLPLKMGRVNSLCSVCSCVALHSSRLPHSKMDTSNPTALTQGSWKAVEKFPPISVDFWIKGHNLPTC